MDNIRVYVNNTEVGYYKMEDTGVAFTWQAKLIDEINSFSTTTTKTITLPLTNTLKTLLKNPEIIDSTTSLTNREYFSIKIDWNSTLAINGWIKLQRVVVLENDEYIEFTVEPKEKDWITQFKEFKLTQLDFAAAPNQTHSLTYANIVASEAYLPLTREYVYAPIDTAEIGRLQVLWVDQSLGVTYFYYYGKQVVTAGSTFTANTYGFAETALTRYAEVMTEVADAFWNTRGVYKCSTATLLGTITYYNQNGFMWVKEVFYWQVSDFTPLIQHTAIIRRCFERIGYAVTIVDSDDYFDSKYNYLHNTEQTSELDKTNNHFKVRVIDAGMVFTGLIPTNTLYIVPFVNFVDTYGLDDSAKYWDTGSSTQATVAAGANISNFTSTETLVTKFKWDFSFILAYSSSAAAPIITISIDHLDSGAVVRRNLMTQAFVYTAGSATEYCSGSVETGYTLMLATDYVQATVNVYITGGGAGATFTISADNFFENFVYEHGVYKGKFIRPNHFLPDRTAYDYIKDLSLINNWEFYTNEKLKQVYIVREDNKRIGKQIDFTQKLNRKKEVELEEVGLQWPKKIYFNWKQDKDDWCIKFIEKITSAKLNSTYKNKEELAMASRFGMGLITNLNLFTIEVQEFVNDVYAASLDKFDTGNRRINFNTVEMKGEEQWPHLPTWKRIDYEPRYLTITFGETLEAEGVGGITGVAYQIENNTNHTTYPRVEFQNPLHYGGTYGLLNTKYAKRIRAIKYGWILRGRFDINENDVNTFVEVYEQNNFRGDYALQLKGVKQRGELLKVNDFSPATFDQTEIEFVIFRDDL